MSSVTSVWILVGNSDSMYSDNEERAVKLANDIQSYIHFNREWDGEPDDVSDKVISLLRDDWDTLQFGSKVAGGSAIWFGWNYADVPLLVDHLRVAEWKNITIQWQHENDDEISVEILR